MEEKPQRITKEENESSFHLLSPYYVLIEIAISNI